MRSAARRRGVLVGLAAAALVVLLPAPAGAVPPSGPPVIATMAAADTVLVREGDVVDEDLFAAGSTVRVEGTIEGDLVVATGTLIVTGVIEGDVTGTVGEAILGGEIRGSVRLAAGQIRTDGMIADDLAVVAGTADLDGTIGRDVLMLGGQLTVTGEVGRDVRGQYGIVSVTGRVLRDVDVIAQNLEIGSGARVDGDVVYLSGSEARISGAADVGGTVTRREPLRPNIRIRALQVLSALLAFVGFVLTGVLLLWLLPSTTTRGTQAVSGRPGFSFLVGIGALIGIPVAAVLVGLTLIGLPVALVTVALWLFGLFAGPVPAVTALGERMLGGRGGRYGGFVVGAIVYRLLRIIPFIGPVITLVGVTWGLGGWAWGAWAARAAGRAAEPEPPPARGEDFFADQPGDEEWLAPLPPDDGVGEVPDVPDTGWKSEPDSGPEPGPESGDLGRAPRLPDVGRPDEPEGGQSTR